MSKNMNVPKLRFSEFSGVWEEKKLENIFKITAGGDIKPENVSLFKDDIFKYPIYANAEKNKGFYGYANIYKIEPNVITVAGRGVNLGIAHARKHKFYPIVRLLVLNPKIESNIDFFEYQINNINMLIESTGVPQLTAPQISKYKVCFPSKQEQEKIASFLNSIDTKIEQLTKKESLLQEYKKGVMQKIFNQEIRFKADDGSEFCDWEEKKLNKLTKIYDGTHLTPKYVEKGIPFYSVEHVTANQFKNTKYITEEVFKKENKRVKLEKNDILMTKIGDIGTSRLIDWDVNASFYVSLALIKANKSFCSSFLNQYIKSNYFQKQLHSKTLHVAFPKKINLGEIGECIVLFPNIQEQTKIANFLSSIDKKIEKTKKELEKTKEFKKALLQQMFV